MPDYEMNWHHEVMCDKLQKWINKEIRNLMIFMPPRHGKSELASKRTPAYILGINPNAEIIGCSYSAELASKFNRDVQRVMDEEEYKLCFPKTQLNNSNIRTVAGSYLRNSDVFEVVGHKGIYRSAGIGGGVTGIGGDYIIVDDPIKNAEQAASITMRNKVWDWYTSTLFTRQEKKASMLLILTRWHEDDLAGRLLKLQPDKWDVLTLPAIAEQKKHSLDIRETGDALWANKYDLDELSNIKDTVGSRVWSSLYQQRPAPEDGGIIKTNWFDIENSIDDVFKEIKVQRPPMNFYVDTAYTEKTKNDPSGFLATFFYKNILYVCDAETVHKEFPDLLKFVNVFVERNNYTSASRVLIEPKASGLSVIQAARQEMNLNVIAAPTPKDSKTTRTYANQAFMEAKRVKLIKGAWNDAFLLELAQFPNGAHDEYVDLLNMAIQDVQQPQTDIDIL